MSDFGKGINVPSKDIVYRQDVEDMLRNALPSRGMWEIEGDVAKNIICETVVDLMMDLEKLPSAQPETAKRIVGKSRDGMTLWYQCDMCNEPVDVQDNYCRGCGRRLTDG